MPVSAEIKQEIKIPEGVDITVEGRKITVKGEKATLERILSHPKIRFEKKNNIIIVDCKMPTKKEAALAGTFAGHIRNMIEGVTHGFTYEMKLVYAHFPVKTSVRGREFVIENFLGERTPRKAKIVGETKIDIKGEKILLTGPDIENVSQTAANIEKATKIKDRDSRVFQDGIYIVMKGE
ncbi:MAG: 50S ribosomal protein L6 [Thermoplasmatales archaeon]|nr:50S ribosomal protein L6 [Thermoplasmatales archaeon]